MGQGALELLNARGDIALILSLCLLAVGSLTLKFDQDTGQIHI